MSTHQDKSLETLQATVRGQLLVAGGNGFDLSSPELEPALAKQTQVITTAAQKYGDERELMLMERLLHVEEIYDDGDEQQCVWTINTTDLHHAAKAVADRLRKGAS